ncbi:MAG TPA: 1-acyl-sn-glycerol-3-phosphate acyltransferase [Firmicutes bacterium]|nr:1-acyl-sn-glycerol-3-phosphate acyltransferase [Bacillota bacterium]
MRKQLFFGLGWIYVILGLPLLGVATLLDKLRLTKVSFTIAHRYMAALAGLLLRLAGAKVKVEGKENLPTDLPVVFISSHQGHFDSAVILAHIRVPLTFVATSNAAKFPVISQWFRLGSTIYMERGNLRQNYQAIKEAEAVLAEGTSVVIYPEGIISGGPHMGEFKRGSFRLATDTNVPIVPLVIDGSWALMGPDENGIEPAHVVLRILPPVPTAGLSRDQQHALPEEIYGLISQNLNEIQSRRVGVNGRHRQAQ